LAECFNKITLLSVEDENYVSLFFTTRVIGREKMGQGLTPFCIYRI